MLAGKYRAGAWPDGARFTRYRDHSPRTKSMTRRFVNERTLATTERVHAIARDCGIAPVTFAVAWVLSRDFVGSALVGVTGVDQLTAQLAAAEAEIPEDALRAVDAVAKEIRHPME